MIVDIVYGFLGSGKTTFIRRILQEWGRNERIVVLVNEFGEVGIDGDLLSQAGGEVVEMPSGCICCTIQSDFRTQMLDISRNLKPDRVIVEPTGVATITQIIYIFNSQLFENIITDINYLLVVDAAGFMKLYKANPHFVESQIGSAQMAILNKCDLVKKNKAYLTQSAISAINPEISVLMTEYGAVDWEEYRLALAERPGRLPECRPTAGHFSSGTDFQGPARDRTGHNHVLPGPDKDGLGYESFGRVFESVSFDRNALSRLFLDLKKDRLGQVVRAKGIFKTGSNWLLMELASGRISSQTIRPCANSRLSVIGLKLDREMIGDALTRCVAGAIL